MVFDTRILVTHTNECTTSKALPRLDIRVIRLVSFVGEMVQMERKEVENDGAIHV